MKGMLFMKQNFSKQNVLRLLALALCIVMCFTLGACGNSSAASELTVGDSDEYVGFDEMNVGDSTQGNTSNNGTNSATGDTSSSNNGGNNANNATSNNSSSNANNGNNANNGGNANNNTNNGGNNSTSAGDEFLKQIPQKLQGTTVTFAVWGDENATEYAKVIKHFTKKTKINVKWVTYNEDKYVSTIVEQNAAGKGPDIVIMNFTFPTVLETVQELPSQFNINDGFWDPRVTKAFSVKGKNYFVNSYNSPFANGGTFVYYNKQIFSNNNIKSPQDYVDEGKWTWENLAKCVREVNQKGFDGGTIFPQYVWPSTGSVMVNYNPDTATFSSGLANKKDKNNIVAALQYVSELCKDGVISNNPVHRLTTGQTALALVEHFGMKYNGWFKGISPSALGIVNIPDTFNGQKAEYISTCQRGYGIGKNAKNIDGAYYVLRYFLDIDNYDDANADIFLNKNMERFYKEEFLPMYKTRKMQVEYMQVPLALAGSPWTTTAPASWTEVFAAGSPDAVVTALDARVNIVNNAAKKATEKVQSIIK